MANVKFLRGPQGNLFKEGFQVQDGAFYLTTDTNRLYVAQGSSLALLNQTVKVVADRTALNNLTNVTEGDFSYISDINVLAVYKDGAWTQINPDTYLTASTTALSTDVADDFQSADIKIEFKDSANHVVSGTAKIKRGTENVTFTKDSEGILINVASPETVEFDLVHTGAANEAKIALQKTIGKEGSPTTEGEFQVKAGANASVGHSLENGVNVITVAANDMYNTNVSIAPTPADGEGNKANGFTIQVVDKKGAVTGTFDPTIEIGNSVGSLQEVHFIDGKADLDVYTTGEIDSLLAAYEKKIDAMTYRGTISSDEDLAKIENPENGDVVKLNTDDAPYKAGDVFIYSKPEGATEGTWEYVPSGNEDTTYALEVGSNSISITNETDALDKAAISVIGIASNPVNVSGKVQDKTAEITVTHATATMNITPPTTAEGQVDIEQVANSNTTVNLVTEVEATEYGHISKITTQKVLLKDTHANIDTVTHAVSAENNIATISTEVKDSDKIAKNDSFTLSSTNSTLSITSSEKNVNIELVWGQF